MVLITGDTHGDWTRLKHPNFRNYELTSEDTIIVAGDFGIWDTSAQQRKDLNSLARCPYTILFCDGNHENFDMLENDFPVVDFKGGKAHQIRENIFHLMRGEVFTIEGKKYFTFGGARSHDIKDGIYDIASFSSYEEFTDAVIQAQKNGLFFRIKGWSWWEQEMPSKREMCHGLDTLEQNNWKVDYIITHSLPTDIQTIFSGGRFKSDELTQYFCKVAEKTDFKKWFSGHYHADYKYDKYQIVYNLFEPIR